MNYSQTKEACDLISTLDFIKLCRRYSPFNEGKLTLKSETSGTPEYKLSLLLKDVVLKAIEDDALARLTELGIEPDQDEEAPKPP